jgi:hypothetical protein
MGAIVARDRVRYSAVLRTFECLPRSSGTETETHAAQAVSQHGVSTVIGQTDQPPDHRASTYAERKVQARERFTEIARGPDRC